MCQQCNSCHQCQPYCQCDNRTTYDPCASNTKCIQKVDAECVIYEMNNPNGLSELKCLNLPTGTTLKQFMIAVDRKFCTLSADVYVKVSEDDKVTGYLEDKILVGQCMKLVKKDHKGGKALSVELDFECLCKYIKDNCNLTGCVDIDDGDYLPTPVPIPQPVPVPVPAPVPVPVPVPQPVTVPVPVQVPVPVPVQVPVPVPVECTAISNCNFN